MENKKDSLVVNGKEDALLTLREAAGLLKISRSLLYRLIEEGYPLPVIRVGTLIRFRAVELIEFFKSGAHEKARQERKAAVEQAARRIADKVQG